MIANRNFFFNFIKQVLILVLISLVLISCKQSNNKQNNNVKSDNEGFAEFTFPEEIHNFGKLNAGEIVSFTFVFRNTGNKTLRISNIDSGCACNKVIVSDENIEPGNESYIEVIYNSRGDIGRQLKTITIQSNATKPKINLFLKADVTNDNIELNS